MKIFNLAILCFFALAGFSLSLVNLVQADASNAVALYRYFKRFEEGENILRDHWSSTSLQTTSPTSQGYTQEGPQGNLAKTNPGNLRTLYDCTRQITEEGDDGNDLTINEHYPNTSNSGTNCELLGYMAPSQASGTHALYKCLGGEGNTSISLASNCEGGADVTNQGILGYAWNTAGSVPGGASPTPSGGGGGSCSGDTDNSTCNVSRNKPDGCSCTNNNQCRSGVNCAGWSGQGKICYGVGGLCGQVRGRPDYCDCEKANQCASNVCTRGTCGSPVCKTPTPTPTPTLSPTPTPSVEPTPTPPPGLKFITRVEVAEDANLTKNKKIFNAPFDDELDLNGTSLLEEYTFLDTSPGKKFVWIRFTASDDTLSPIFGPFSIELVKDPIEIISVRCPRDESGNVNFTIVGRNFGSTPGIVKSEEETLTLSSEWSQNPSVDKPLKVKLSGAEDQNSYNISITRFDGEVISTECNSSLTQISVGAKYFCPAIPDHLESGVKMTIYDGAERSVTQAKLAEELVNINVNGIIERPDPTVNFQVGHPYAVSIETATSVRRFGAFTPTDDKATTQVLNIELPVGDIAPEPEGDGKINAPDVALLHKQWSLDEASAKSGDFNTDERINSFDYACMRYNYNKSDQVPPRFPITSTTPVTGGDSFSGE